MSLWAPDFEEASYKSPLQGGLGRSSAYMHSAVGDLGLRAGRELDAGLSVAID